MVSLLHSQGFRLIPQGAYQGVAVKAFHMRPPVTNREYTEFVRGLRNEPCVRLDHDRSMGETRLVGTFRGEGLFSDRGTLRRLNSGHAIDHDLSIFVKMLENPSALFDTGISRPSDPDQPVVGLNYFQALAYCLLQSRKDGVRYNLPTGIQLYYAANHRGIRDDQIEYSQHQIWTRFTPSLEPSVSQLWRNSPHGPQNIRYHSLLVRHEPFRFYQLAPVVEVK